MNKKELMAKYIRKLKRKKELTSFIANIFDYKNFHEYNYIFRMLEETNRVVIDIYDNISNNRFNRYIFNFKKSNLNNKTITKNNVFITYINIEKLKDSNNKLYKLAYLFKLNKKEMIEYANTFLDEKHVDILKTIIK